MRLREPARLGQGDLEQRPRRRQPAQVVGQRSRQELVADDAQRVDVRAFVDGRRAALRLLGTHVADGAQQLPGRGHERGPLRVVFLQVGDAEIKHMGTPIRRHDDVLGLQVTVHHAVPVGALDGVAQFREQAHAFRLGGMGLVAPPTEHQAVDVLGGQVRQAVGDPRVQQARNAGMFQSAQDLDLALEPALHHLAERSVAQNLEGDDWPRLPAVFGRPSPGAVDHAHAALAQQVEHLVGPDEGGNDRRPAPEVVRLRPGAVDMAGQQFQRLAAHGLVRRAGLAHERLPRFRRQREGFNEDLAHSLETTPVDSGNLDSGGNHHGNPTQLYRGRGHFEHGHLWGEWCRMAGAKASGQKRTGRHFRRGRGLAPRAGRPP